MPEYLALNRLADRRRLSHDRQGRRIHGLIGNRQVGRRYLRNAGHAGQQFVRACPQLLREVEFRRLDVTHRKRRYLIACVYPH